METVRRLSGFAEARVSNRKKGKSDNILRIVRRVGFIMYQYTHRRETMQIEICSKGFPEADLSKLIFESTQKSHFSPPRLKDAKKTLSVKY